MGFDVLYTALFWIIFIVVGVRFGMGVSGIYWLIAIVFIIVGLVLMVRAVQGPEQKAIVVDDEIQDKDGVPILPRSERKLDEDAAQASSRVQFDEDEDIERAEEIEVVLDDEDDGKPTDDALSSLATVAAARTRHDEEVGQDDKKAEVLSEEVVISEVFDVDVTDELKESDTVVLNDYFHQSAEETFRDNDALLGHKKTVTIVISPRNSFEGINGTKIMELVRQYGLKYGILNMFHRYELADGTGMLWFSMLGVSVDGVESFDLVSLPEMNYRGLALFLSLPHPQALKGFDSMVQTAMSIAEELQADIHDEMGYILDSSQLQALRAMVTEELV